MVYFERSMLPVGLCKLAGPSILLYIFIEVRAIKQGP